ncbi:hypothetical protein [Amycolatopsis jejuensis]|uniref:hypothetical protein n=1 Tax=Amycolatopsis jejuensis TaxID=330084 RepID=UPI001FE113FA|nr:hypothetical protein [Amycolatopsis jejuensis]
MPRVLQGLFIAEGTSDQPLANTVEVLFRESGIELRLTVPPYEQLPKVAKTIKDRTEAGQRLMECIDVVVVHRDSDNVGHDVRREEIDSAMHSAGIGVWCPIVPVRMTEAWLLLDEKEIRRVAGNPKGRASLGLPKRHEVERVADPKEVLRKALLDASAATGRRREREAKRFNSQRRQLLEGIDREGPLKELSSWQQLLEDVARSSRLLRP